MIAKSFFAFTLLVVVQRLMHVFWGESFSMSKLRIIAVAILLPLFLAACQTSQVSTNSYGGGSAFTSLSVKTASRPSPRKKAKKDWDLHPFFANNEETWKSLKNRPAAKKTSSRKKATRKTTKLKKTNSKKRVSSKAKISAKKKAPQKIAARKTKKGASSKSAYRSIIRRHARAHGVPVKLAMAVVQG